MLKNNVPKITINNNKLHLGEKYWHPQCSNNKTCRLTQFFSTWGPRPLWDPPANYLGSPTYYYFFKSIQNMKNLSNK